MANEDVVISPDQIENDIKENRELGPTMVAGRVASGTQKAAEKYAEKTGGEISDIPKAINKQVPEKGKNAKVIIDEDGKMNEETEVNMDKEEK